MTSFGKTQAISQFQPDYSVMRVFFAIPEVARSCTRKQARCRRAVAHARRPEQKCTLNASPAPPLSSSRIRNAQACVHIRARTYAHRPHWFTTRAAWRDNLGCLKHNHACARAWDIGSRHGTVYGSTTIHARARASCLLTGTVDGK